MSSYELLWSYSYVLLSFLLGFLAAWDQLPVAIISNKDVYKFDKDALAMISTEITMIIAIYVTFGSIVWRSIEPTFGSISTAFLKLKRFVLLVLKGG